MVLGTRVGDSAFRPIFVPFSIWLHSAEYDLFICPRRWPSTAQLHLLPVQKPQSRGFLSLQSIYSYHVRKEILLYLGCLPLPCCGDIRHYNWPSCTQRSIEYWDCHPPLEPHGGPRAGFPKESISITWEPVRTVWPQAPAQNQTAFLRKP